MKTFLLIFLGLMLVSSMLFGIAYAQQYPGTGKATLPGAGVCAAYSYHYMNPANGYYYFYASGAPCPSNQLPNSPNYPVTGYCSSVSSPTYASAYPYLSTPCFSQRPANQGPSH